MRWKQHRKTAAGVLVAGLLGSGLVSLTSDSVTSEDNVLESEAFALPTHDLVVARTLGSDPCPADPTEYDDGPTGPMEVTQFQLPGGTSFQDDNFCLRNAGSQTGRVRVAFVNVIESEAGPCNADEVPVDSSCADGDVGELTTVARAKVDALDAACVPSGSGSALTAALPFSIFEAGAVILDLDPGETCGVFFRFPEVASTTDAQRLAAQTDRIQWDVVFTLSDVV